MLFDVGSGQFWIISRVRSGQVNLIFWKTSCLVGSDSSRVEQVSWVGLGSTTSNC